MPKFRKKSVTIEAVQFTGEVTDEIRALYAGRTIVGNAEPAIFIHTPDGAMKVSKGDWIIRGAEGECYLCKPDIFESMYEALDG